MNLNRIVRLALEPSIVKRGLKYAVIVGTILVMINHGNTLISGDVTTYQLIQIGLTYSVPYIVSSLSSIQAILSEENRQNTNL